MFMGIAIRLVLIAHFLIKSFALRHFIIAKLENHEGGKSQ